jgi:hypothetical protein
MPQVPYTGAQSVEPNYPATPNIHPNANPEAFGAATAAASQRFGVSLERAADSIFARAYSMQELDQQTAAMNAVSAATEKADARLIDYRSQLGLAAKNGYEPFVKDLNGIIAEGGAGLESDVAKKVYQDQMRYLHTHTLSTAGSHAATEFKHYAIGTEQASAENARKTVTMLPDEDQVFDDYVIGTSKQAKSMGVLNGWSPEQEQQWYNKETAKTVYDRATLVARTDPQRADKILQDATERGLIDGESAGKASEFIRGQRNHVMTRVESGKLLSGEGGHFGETLVAAPRAREAIAAVESGGNYNPPHPTVTKGKYAGQHALGRYGIMQGNLAPWLKEAGMPAMSEADFLKDHEAQDKLFDFKFGQLMAEHKSANKAAMVWFTGSPDPKPDANDGHSTAPEYLQKFNAALGKSATSAEIDSVAGRRADELASNDPEFHFNFRDRVLAEHAKDRQIERETDFTNRNTVESALGPGPDGKLPTSIDEIQDPQVKAAWEALPPALQTRYNKVFATNAKADYSATAANQAEYKAWIGKLTDGRASEEDKRAAMDADFLSMKLPMDQRQQLIRLQQKAFKNTAANPKLEHAMSVLQTQLYNADVTRKSDEEGYFQFRGELHEILQQRLEEGKYPDDKEIKEIGAGLLRQTVIKPGWLWDTSGPAFQMDVPDPEVKKITQVYLDSKGREPTEKEIQQIYAVNQFNQFYAKKPKAEVK